MFTSDIWGSFIRLPASPRLLVALQLDQSIHTAHPHFSFSAFCEGSGAICSNLSPFSPNALRKAQHRGVGDICWEVAWIHVTDQVMLSSQRLEHTDNNSN